VEDEDSFLIVGAGAVLSTTVTGAIYSWRLQQGRSLRLMVGKGCDPHAVSVTHVRSSVGVAKSCPRRRRRPGRGRVGFYFYSYFLFFSGARWRQKCAKSTPPSSTPPKNPGVAPGPRKTAQKQHFPKVAHSARTPFTTTSSAPCTQRSHLQNEIPCKVACTLLDQQSCSGRLPPCHCTFEFYKSQRKGRTHECRRPQT
jgi:hypothetical protein